MNHRKVRRFLMFLRTLTGLRKEGFFTPYRHAGAIRRPSGYPELEVAFRAAEPAMRATLADIGNVATAAAALDGPPPTPRWGQSWFPRLDGLAALALVRRHAPARIVEVGSGHSTRMLAHAASADCRIACIDPRPRAELAGLDVDWRRETLSADHLPLFAALRADDIAFFDGSHVLWEGSDADMMLSRILPALASGVLVHVHDVTLPDPYPEDWRWRGYTEQLGLAGYLTSPAWTILWSSHYAVTRLAAAERAPEIPIQPDARETSLWLRRA